MRSRLVTAVLLAVFLTLAFAPDAGAIPAFARKYQFSCSTCHAPFPRLKPFGEEFAARGFRMEKPDAEPARAEYDVGDPLLKLWREFPIASRFEGFAAYHENAAAETDFETPYVFKILSGGQLSPQLSYYLYFIVEKGETVGLEDAFVQYNGLFGRPEVSLIFGQFQLSDPLFKRELRLERFDYAIFSTRVGEARANLTYDRGLMLNARMPGQLDAVLTVVNGNGIPTGTFDQDDHKNLALRLTRQFGPVRAGVFGYVGKEDNGGITDDMTYFGPDLSITAGDRWQLNAEYLRRTDSDPFFAGTSPDFTTDGGFVELSFFPLGQDGRYAWSLLYNKVDSDDPAARIETASVTFNYLLARNFRFLAEVGRDVEGDSTTASVGFVTAF